jgi:hypothetical protein
MESISHQNDYFEVIDVKGENDSDDFDLEFDVHNSNEPSPMPNSSLKLVIRKELNILEGQLEEINSKLKLNYDSLNMKKVQNEEMRKIIEYYNLTTEAKTVSDSACGCRGSCRLF